MVYTLKNFIIEKQYVMELVRQSTALKELLEKNKKLADYSSQEDEKLLEIFKNFKETEKKIVRILNKIEQPYKSILYYKYVVGENFKSIAKKLDYSVTRIYQLHKVALDIFAEISAV